MSVVSLENGSDNMWFVIEVLKNMPIGPGVLNVVLFVECFNNGYHLIL